MLNFRTFFYRIFTIVVDISRGPILWIRILATPKVLQKKFILLITQNDTDKPSTKKIN